MRTRLPALSLRLPTGREERPFQTKGMPYQWKSMLMIIDNATIIFLKGISIVFSNIYKLLTLLRLCLTHGLDHSTQSHVHRPTDAKFNSTNTIASEPISIQFNVICCGVLLEPHRRLMSLSDHFSSLFNSGSFLFLLNCPSVYRLCVHISSILSVNPKNVWLFIHEVFLPLSSLLIKLKSKCRLQLILRASTMTSDIRSRRPKSSGVESTRF